MAMAEVKLDTIKINSGLGRLKKPQPPTQGNLPDIVFIAQAGNPFEKLPEENLPLREAMGLPPKRIPQAAVLPEVEVTTLHLPEMPSELLKEIVELKNQPEPGPLPGTFFRLLGDRRLQVGVATAFTALGIAGCTPAAARPVVETPPAIASPTSTKEPVIPSPTALKQIIPIPTREATGGGPTPDPKAKQAIYDEANREIGQVEGIQSAQVIAQLESDQYQAIVLANFALDGKTLEEYFLIKPNGQLLALNEKVKGLEWSFARGKATWQDQAGNVFGRVLEAKETKDWQVKIEDYGVVLAGGLPLFNTSFPEGQPLLVQTSVDATGKIVGISVQVSPGSWVEVNAKYLSRIKLTDQAFKNATLATPTPTRPKETPTPVEVELLNPNSTLDVLRYPADQTPNGVWFNEEGFGSSPTGVVDLQVVVLASAKEQPDKSVRVDFRYLDKKTGKLFDVKGAKLNGDRNAPILRDFTSPQGIWKSITVLPPNTVVQIFLGKGDFDKMANGDYSNITVYMVFVYNSRTTQSRINSVYR